jgi:RHS repeat-associated protein
VRDSNLYIFYFAGRPVATLDKVTEGPPVLNFTTVWTLQYLTVDHLGTPILVTNPSGAQVWQGGFEPFGADYSASPTILRFPGQWLDTIWNRNDVGLYYNVHRWYGTGTGRYLSPDPLSLRGEPNPYTYTLSNPIHWIDPLGEKSRTCCTPIASGPLKPFKHCFIEVEDERSQQSHTYSLHGMGTSRRQWGGPQGCTFKDDQFD